MARVGRPGITPNLVVPEAPQTEVLAFDFRAGGAFHTVMHGPDGERSDNPGCFLEVIPQQKIVMTSMLTADYRPAVSPSR